MPQPPVLRLGSSGRNQKSKHFIPMKYGRQKNQQKSIQTGKVPIHSLTPSRNLLASPGKPQRLASTPQGISECADCRSASPGHGSGNAVRKEW